MPVPQTPQSDTVTELARCIRMWGYDEVKRQHRRTPKATLRAAYKLAREWRTAEA